MSNLAELILLRAREWIGTPYVHPAAVKGAGCDCLGLLRGVWREVYGQEPEAAPAYTADWSEASRQERLWEAASRHLKSKSLSDEAGRCHLVSYAGCGGRHTFGYRFENRPERKFHPRLLGAWSSREPAFCAMAATCGGAI